MELVVSSQSMQIKKQSLQIEQQSSQIAELVSLIKSLSQRETEEEAKAAPSGSKTHLLFTEASALGTLTPPMQSFLNAQETLSKIRQYATIGHTTHTGEPLCVSTVESIYSALVLGCLHKSYAFIKAKYSGTGTGEKLPFPHELQDYVCSHYDTVISQEYSIVNTGA
eukprot:gene9548-11312_t